MTVLPVPTAAVSKLAVPVVQVDDVAAERPRLSVQLVSVAPVVPS